jgi:hypothetical protein
METKMEVTTMNGSDKPEPAPDPKDAVQPKSAPPLYLRQAKEEAVKLLLRPHGNIVGIGIGKKAIGAEVKDCLRFYVISKIKDTGELPGKDVVPAQIRVSTGDPQVPYVDVPTDVIEVGRFGRPGHPPKATPGITPRPGSRIRVSTDAPNVNQGARGTFGAVVTDGTNRYILGCNHLLAVNGRVPNDADLVSAEFVGSQKTLVGNMTYTYVKLDDGPNYTDCAMVKLPESNHQPPTSFPDGHPLSSAALISPDIDMPVTKYGAVTGRTDGTIVDISVDLYVDYAFGTFLLQDQVMIQGTNDPDHFASAGDSGSLLVHGQKQQAMAMIFAASGLFAVACPLQDVLDRLKSEARVAKLELRVD